MFTIHLHLSDYPSLEGCQALDFERLWHLTETARVCSSSSVYSVDCQVPESFARAYFRPDRRVEYQTVPLALLLPGEIVRPDGGQTICLAPELSATRCMELFVAANVAALRQQVKERAEQIETLRFRLVEEEEPESE